MLLDEVIFQGRLIKKINNPISEAFALYVLCLDALPWLFSEYFVWIHGNIGYSCKALHWRVVYIVLLAVSQIVICVYGY